MRCDRGKLIRLQRQATKVLFSSIDKDKDRGWMGRFVGVRTTDIIPTEKMPFLEEWNMKHKSQRQSYHEATPAGEEEEAPKPTKDKKRKRVSPSDTPKPKKSTTCRSKKDTAALPTDVVQRLRDEEEENEDVDFELVARKRSAEVPKVVEPIMVEEVQLRAEEILDGGPSKVPELSEVEDVSRHDRQSVDVPEGASSEALQNEENTPSDSLGVQQKPENIEQLRKEAKMKEEENLGWTQNMDRLASEKDIART
ncbi:uncharacterized protein [Nicotiana sylvestris]|uniref:uncharacterized protein n=1 Tax=Nicotiana sylvestris TaxID=4096 RepID=UPI00388CA110